MRLWKKGLIWSVIIVFGLWIILNRGYIMAHLTSEFRFEKYKTAEEAEKALLQLHPVGSDVQNIARTLQQAGMIVEKDYHYRSINIKRDLLNKKNNYKSMYATYKWRTSFLPWKIIAVQILIKYDKKEMMKEFSLTIYHD